VAGTKTLFVGLERWTAPPAMLRCSTPVAGRPYAARVVIGSPHHGYGALHYLWRAVDQHGVVLDILVQARRNATAAERFFKRLLAGLKYKPKRIVTDGLRSYGAARRGVLPHVRHRTSRYLNNRAENSHRPTRRRERQMQRFKSPGQAQRFMSSHAMIHGHFHPRRHLMTAARYRRARAEAFRVWREETCVRMAV
jgi:putative transposase